jgi:hypothetical protein
MIETPDMAALTALLHRTAIELGDAGALAPIYSVFALWDAMDEHWTVTAQLLGRSGKDGEPADIDDIRAWAQALGGRLLLSEPEPYARTYTRRRLSAVKPICAGVLLEVCAYIAKTGIPETAAA